MDSKQRNQHAPSSPTARGAFACLSKITASPGDQSIVLQPAWRLAGAGRPGARAPGAKAAAPHGTMVAAAPPPPSPQSQASPRREGRKGAGARLGEPPSELQCPQEPSVPQAAQQPLAASPYAQRAAMLPPTPRPPASAPPGRTSFVPIKSWRTCWEVADGMAGLPPGRLDQKLLSAALQHMATVSGSGHRASIKYCLNVGMRWPGPAHILFPGFLLQACQGGPAVAAALPSPGRILPILLPSCRPIPRSNRSRSLWEGGPPVATHTAAHCQ
jgi:hypothetical protein